MVGLPFQHSDDDIYFKLPDIKLYYNVLTSWPTNIVCLYVSRVRQSICSAQGNAAKLQNWRKIKLKGLEQFRKQTPLFSIELSPALWLFLYAQHGLHFVAFNNLPLQAPSPWDTFFPTLFVPLCFYLPAAARRSEQRRRQQQISSSCSTR